MKKILSMSIAAALCSIVLSACNNDPAEPLTYNAYQTATVKGKVLVNTDYSIVPGNQTWSACPASIAIVAEVSNSSITGQAAQGDYTANATYNATTGEYTVTVPVSAIGSTVKITVKDWTGTAKVSRPTTENPEATATIDVLWRSAETSAFVKPGEESINNNILFDGTYEELDTKVGGDVN